MTVAAIKKDKDKVVSLFKLCKAPGEVVLQVDVFFFKQETIFASVALLGLLLKIWPLGDADDVLHVGWRLISGKISIPAVLGYLFSSILRMQPGDVSAFAKSNILPTCNCRLRWCAYGDFTWAGRLELFML